MALLAAQGKLTWDASASSDVAGYYVYVGDDTTVDYTSQRFDIGNVTEVNLPIPGQSMVDAPIKIGIAAVDNVGNVSDLTIITVPVDTDPPAPVTDLVHSA